MCLPRCNSLGSPPRVTASPFGTYMQIRKGTPSFVWMQPCQGAQLGKQSEDWISVPTHPLVPRTACAR